VQFGTTVAVLRNLIATENGEKTVAGENFNQETLRFLGEATLGEGKCRVESELILPEYKQTVQRILRVEPKARISRKNVVLQGDSAVCEVEGVVAFHILYWTEGAESEGKLSSFLAQEPFHHTVKISLDGKKYDSEEMISSVEVAAENSSFKLLGPRKIALRSDVKLMLTVCANQDFSYYSEDFSENVCCRCETVSATRMMAAHLENITISETISLPKKDPSVGEICEMDVEVFAKEVQAREGGVYLLGCCDIRCCYLSEGDGAPVSFTQPIEFEKNIGVSECTPSSLCRVTLTPDFMNAACDINEDGENKSVLFEISCSAEIDVFEQVTVSVAKDVYSTDCYLDVETEEKKWVEIVKTMDFSSAQKGSIPWENGEKGQVEALRCTTSLTDSYWEKDGIALEGTVRFRFLTVGEKGEVRAADALQNFKVHVPVQEEFCPEECRIEVCALAHGADLVFGENTLEAEYELSGNITVFCRHRMEALSSVSMGDRMAPAEKCLIFYYPQKGEDVWEVAKKFKVSPERLRQENGIGENDLPSVLKITL